MCGSEEIVMVRRSAVRLRVVALAALVFMPASLVFGQGIAGVVKDTSGGVLPGVIVEAGRLVPRRAAL